MTTRIKIEYMQGNKAVEVIDLRDGSVAVTLNGQGDVFEQNLHGDAQFTVRETGDFIVVPGKASHDDAKKSGSRSGFPQEDTPLPSGAGEPGSSVPDVRIPDSATAPSPSSDDVPADRQAQQEAVRTRNSPTSRS